ncbi:MAG TPA: hypothetical protein VF911_19305 [Thermoanaerobaculia bacterium]
MMRAAKSAIVAAALFVAAAQVAAQQHANIERGLMPEKSYQVSDVDNVNVFNGTVNISIPLGIRYSAGGNLSYQFMASYATNGWENGEDVEYEIIDSSGEELEHHRYWTAPDLRMNAGLGWLVSLGDIAKSKDTIHWIYRSPDGGQHTFYDTLHANSGETVPPATGGSAPLWVQYTRDGTYLRLRKCNDRYELDLPNGNIHRFDNDGRLTRMDDPYGHYLTVTYGTRSATDSYAGSSMWTVSDSTGRTHFIYYEMLYAFGSKQYCAWPHESAPGNITSLRLPTGAKIGYTYGVAEYAAGESDVVAAVSKRTVSLGATVVSVTEYEHDRYAPGFEEKAQRRLVRETDGEKILSETRHYFSTCASSTCGSAREYALPFSREAMPAAGPFISTEVLTRDAANNPVVQRTTYVIYEGDGNLANSGTTETDLNRRMRYSKTVVEDGTSTETSMSKFDGLGNYRQAVTTNTNPAGGNSRTTVTNYNPSRGEFNVASNGSVSGGFIMPLFTDPWILGTYNKQQVTEGAQTSTVATCFDATGFLTGRRTFAGFGATPARQANDLLEIYTRVDGEVGTEQYLGGDDPDPADSSDGYVGAPLASDCVTSSATDNYRIVHKYDNGYGSRRASYFIGASGQPLSPFILDQDIDPSTGQPIARRVGSSVGANGVSLNNGLQTNFEYDVLGRLFREAPPTSATANRGASRRTLFTNNATTVEVREETADGSSVLRSRTLNLDGLGRATKEIRSRPDGTTAWRTWEYDGAGRITALSAWGNQTPVLTTYEYDYFGRPLRQTAPDGKLVTFAYPTTRETSTTTTVHTGATTETNATTTQELDGLGRLRRVTDAAGMQTRYAYDVRDRLTEVCLGESGSGCLQVRSFTYDNRGFLISETMPELGASGGGSTSYRYDSRGNVVRKTIGSAGGVFDVMMKYDRMGRLSRIHEARTINGVQRNLKVFEYGTPNSAGDYSSGKLLRAIRHNWLDDIATNVQVVETYTYAGIDGRADSRVTFDRTCGGSTAACNEVVDTPDRKFTQSFTYDALGAVTSLEQPSCLLPQVCADAPIPDRTVTNTYQKGWLTSVTWTSAPRAATIDYHDNGMISRVTHANLVKDEVFLDANRVPRPHQLQTTNAIEDGACVAPTFGAQPQSQTITANDLATLSATAAGESGLAVSYQWYRGVAGDRSTPLGSGTPTGGGGTTYTTPALTASTNYWLEATNTCPGGATMSATALVTVCHAPSITAQPQSDSITRSETVTLNVTANEHGTATYQWYTVTGTSTLTAINGASSPTLTVTPSSTTRYRVKVTNECGVISSTIATITVANPPTPPSAVTASSNGVANTITWSASSSTVGILRYEIRRLNGVSLSVIMPAALSVVHSNGVVTGSASLYRVRAVDANGVAGPWSVYDNTVTMVFTDFPLQVGSTIRGLHVAQLRQAIDALRAQAGLARGWPDYNALTGVMYASHVIDMRNKLNEARTRLALSLVTFSRPTLVPEQAGVLANDLQELCNGVQ